MSVEIKRVENRKDLRRFIEFHYDLYEGNPYDVPNLYSDELNPLSFARRPITWRCEMER